jgi:hypothetical protein
MPVPLSDEQLTKWAREHLVYEVGMLMYAAEELAYRRDDPRDRESNVLLESFVIHARCLSHFLWHSRKPKEQHEHDAFAEDLCAQGAWELKRPPMSSALRQAIYERTGPEIAHLSYHRLAVLVAEKDWRVGRITVEIAAAVEVLAQHALPERLDDETRYVLEQLTGPPPVGTSPIVANSRSIAASPEYTYRGGTIELSDFEVGS